MLAGCIPYIQIYDTLDNSFNRSKQRQVRCRQSIQEEIIEAVNEQITWLIFQLLKRTTSRQTCDHCSIIRIVVNEKSSNSGILLWNIRIGREKNFVCLKPFCNQQLKLYFVNILRHSGGLFYYSKTLVNLGNPLTSFFCNMLLATL